VRIRVALKIGNNTGRAKGSMLFNDVINQR